MRILKKNTQLSLINGMIVDLATPININGAWNFGSILGLILVFQIATGFLLAGRYTASTEFAFTSIDVIMREVSFGWLLRYGHAIGAGFFLSAAYIHMARGIYYSSYKTPRASLWLSGVLLFILLMATAFLGYVLVWSSMSFWAAVVITNLAGSLPYIGQDLLEWIWAGFSVSNPTLVRFYSIHYLLPFLIAGVSIVHLSLLHQNGSSNPIGITSDQNKIRFAPFYIIKDILGFVIVGLIFSGFLFFEPDYLNHADAFQEANPLVTPATIVPEFYFLPFYCLLRAIPNKLGGVIVMGAAILILVTLPSTTIGLIRTTKFRPLSSSLFWCFVANFLLLGWLGQKPAQDPYTLIAQMATLFYFAYFIILLPLAEWLEVRALSWRVI